MRDSAFRLSLPRVLALFAAVGAAATLLARGESGVSPALLLTLEYGAEVAASEEPAGARQVLAILGNGTGGGELRHLVEEFDHAGSPSVSYDGHDILFAGRRTPAETTQIWAVPVDGSSPRLVVRCEECLDPAHLPDGGFVYARRMASNGSSPSFALHVAQADGQGERRITFGIARDRSPLVLPDGRIAFRRDHPGERVPGRIFAVNPDGTGLQLLRAPSPGESIQAGPWLVGDRLAFAETIGGATQALISVSVHDPQGERHVLAGSPGTDLAGATFTAATLLPEESILLAAILPDKGAILSTIARDGSIAPHASSRLRSERAFPTGAVVLPPQRRPLALTSVVQEEKSTGTLLCLDVYTSQIPALRQADPGTVASVRVLDGSGSVLGEAPVELDGSFFVEVPADQALQLEIVGADGAVASDRTGFWVRPNENRGCIGCHEDPALAPENRVPLALARGASQLRPPGAVR